MLISRPKLDSVKEDTASARKFPSVGWGESGLCCSGAHSNLSYAEYPGTHGQHPKLRVDPHTQHTLPHVMYVYHIVNSQMEEEAGGQQ